MVSLYYLYLVIDYLRSKISLLVIIMNKKDRAKIIKKRLDELYPNPAIPLDHKDEFTLLVSVILSAQSTDKKVNELTPVLFKLADNPHSMSNLSEFEIYSAIKHLGLSKTKSINIKRMSQALVEKHNGKVPSTFDELEALAGVGHKTASVLMSQAFGIPAFPIDTHIHRLAQRWGLTSGINVKQTEKDLKALFPEASWNKLHIQIILYGREKCTAKSCYGLTCQICREIYPKRTKQLIHSKA